MCILTALPSYAQNAVHYYFKTMDIRNGLSQNTVYQILQDRKGFMWFGTKDGLNRYDGLSYRVYKKENSGLGKNFITALYEDHEGNIWIGTDGGVFIYNPVLDSFTAFNQTSDKGTVIKDFVTMIGSDEYDNIWISVENQGLFCYNHEKRLRNYLHDSGMSNVARFWLNESTCWLALYADNLYYTKDNFESPLQPFKDADGNEIFKGDIINWHVSGPHNCVYIASVNGLTEINFTTGKTRRLLNAYVRVLQFKSDDELWVGTESGLYIYNLANDKVTHLSVPDQDDSYALSDNAIYSLCRDKENGMWIGSYFGGVNYYPYQWTYFEKFYPRDDLRHFGRRVREICESNDGTLWIVDPLDGTKEFIKRNGEFTVNIALVKEGVPVFGVIYVPVKETLYWGEVATGAYKMEGVTGRAGRSLEEMKASAFRMPCAETNEVFVIVASRSHLSAETEEYIEEKRKIYPHVELVSVGSSIKICKVCEGLADEYPRFAPTMEWDTAAGHAIAKASGAEIYQAGKEEPLKYNKPDLLNPWFVVKRN